MMLHFVASDLGLHCLPVCKGLLVPILRVIMVVQYMMSLSLFVLRFYGPVNPMGSCRARSVYLTTRLLGRLSPLSG